MNCPKCNHKFEIWYMVDQMQESLELASDASFVTASATCSPCGAHLEFYYPLTTIEEQV